MIENTGNFLLLVIGFSLVIFIHEFGHFIVAKWVGIRVDQFAIGFGQAALAWRKGLGIRVGTTTPEYQKKLADGAVPDSMSETEYRLNWFPLGGYVKMLGQDDLDQAHASDDPRSYSSKSIGARMAVISAGVILNVVSAFILFVGCFMYGILYIAPVIGGVRPNSPAATAVAINAEDQGITEAGLHPGDRVLEVAGRKALRFTDLQLAVVMSKPGDLVEFVIDRDGVELQFALQPVDNETTGMMEVGIAPSVSLKIDPVLAEADQADFLISEKARWGMADADLKPGMILSAVNGQAINGYWELQRFAESPTDGFEVELEFRAADDASSAAAPIRTMAKLKPEFTNSMTTAENLLGFTPLIRIGGRGADRKSNALAAGIQAGDVIVRMNDVNWPTQLQLLEMVQTQAGQEIELVVLRDGERLPFTVKANRKGAIGIQMTRALDEVRVNTMTAARIGVSENAVETEDTENSEEVSPPVESTDDGDEVWAAAQITPLLPAGSRILSVNGNAIGDWCEFKDVLTAATNPESERNVVRLVVELALPTNPIEEIDWEIPGDQVAELHRLGWSLEPRIFAFEEVLLQSWNPLKAINYGLNETMRMLTMTYLTIDRVLVRRSVGAKNIKGPIGIAQLGTQVADKGLPYLIMFLAIISVNLAVLNFLPIPILDGGQFLFLLIEKLKGSPVNPAIQDLATLAGLVILGGLFLFVTFNDITNLFTGGL